MAGKIPVGETIARAYGFAFGNIFNNLGLIWIPVALLWAFTYFVYMPRLMALMPMEPGGDPTAVLASLRFVFVFAIAVMVLLVAQIALLTREALGLRKGASFLQFPFGAATWRLIGAYLLFFLVILVIYIGSILAGIIGGGVLGYVASQTGGSSKMVVGVLIGVFVLIILCALFYIIVRLSFFLAPVAVAEKRISLIRSWQLGQGNFWRMFIIGLSIWIPLIVLEIGFIYWMWGTSFLPPLHATPDQLAEFARHQRELSRQMTQQMQSFWYISYPITLLFGLIFYGLIAGASAFAYRALVPLDADVPVEA